MQIRIDERLRTHIPALKPDEYKQLEENILAHGCQSPLIVWGDVLLDGHNRYDICNRHGVPFRVETIDLPDFEAATAWIEENQLGRRNLTPDQLAYYIGKKYQRLKKAGGGRADRDFSGDQNDHPKTSEIIAEQHGMSAPTVRRADAFAQDVDGIADAFGDEARARLLSGEDKLTRKDVAEIAAFAEETRKAGAIFQSADEAIDYAKTAQHHLTRCTGENKWYTPPATDVAVPDEPVARGKDEILRLANRIRAEEAKAEKAERAQRIAEAAASVPAASERYTIIHGPLTELLNHPAESVDFIITDPPYPREFLPVFGQLGEVAKHLLKPGGLLLCMSGQTYLSEVYAQLNQHLDYYWTIAYLTPGGQATQVFPRRVITFWKPVLVYAKGEYTGDWFADVTRSDTNASDKRHHHWGQSVSGMRDLMKRFVRPGHVVVDPFLGGGTTAVVALELGASFVGCDVDEEAINATKARLAGVELAA
jgi:hypothetical protein